MNVREFSTESECLAFLEEQLRASGTGQTLQPALGKAFCEACNDSNAPNEAPVLGLQIGRWVVRDDDLDLFKIIRDSLVSLASTSFILKDLPTSSMVSLTLGLVSLLRNVIRSGARLTPDQASVIAALKSIGGPATASYLAGMLSLAGSDSSETLWSGERVLKTLASLKEVVTKKDVISLVRSVTTNGVERWTVVGA